MITIFPIMFAAILATAIRRYALYRAQQGDFVGTLEQLHGSISLPATIKMMLSLRLYTVLGAALLVIWSFSYLGSQASKREYFYATSGPWSNFPAVYANNQSGSYFDDSDLLTKYAPDMNRNFLWAESYRLSKTGRSLAGVDWQGAVQIPDVAKLKELHWTPGHDNEIGQWHDVYPSTTNYTALTGRTLYSPIKDPNSKNGYLSMYSDKKLVGFYVGQASYLDIRCYGWEILSEQDFPGYTPSNLWTSINVTKLYADVGQPRLLEVSGKWNASYGNSIAMFPKGPLRHDGLPSGVVKVKCNVTEPQIEYRTHCVEVACLVKQIRYLTLDTTLSVWDNSTWTSRFFTNLLYTYGQPAVREDYGTKIEQFTGPLQLIKMLAYNQSNDTESQKGLITTDYDVELQRMSIRLMQYINTYNNLGIEMLAGNRFERNLTYPDPGPSYTITKVEGAVYEPQYRLSRGWIAIDYISCSILLGSSIFSFWLRKRTLMPDILGYVSSLTRENPYIALPPGGSVLSGIDRTRLMEKLKIKLGDVERKQADIGKIGVYIVGIEDDTEPLNEHRRFL